jgi:Flp pilus assembly protein TadG
MKPNSSIGAGSRKRRLRLSSGGQTIVEFALIVPIFLVILFAIVDFSMALNAWLTVTNSAREGARVLVLGANCSDVTTRAEDVASHLNPQISVTIDPPSCTGNPGDQMAVTVSYQYSYITPVGKFISFLSGGSVPALQDPMTISYTSTMRHE